VAGADAFIPALSSTASTSGRAAISYFRLRTSSSSEGVIGKRADSSYLRGRTTNWVKVKTPQGRHIDKERAKWNEITTAAGSAACREPGSTDRFLLAILGSWGDTMSDAEVLEGLKRWNRCEQPLDRVIASTGGKRG